MPNDNSYIDAYIEEAIALNKAVLQDGNIKNSVHEAVLITIDSFKKGGKVLVAGNGGSAADAQHFAAEFVSRYKLERKGRPAIALTTDTSFLTAYSNDYDYSGVFARGLEALGGAGDVFFGISTSGNSENVIQAIKKAKELGIKTIALLGRDGGKTRGLADVSIIVPSNNTPRIQEVQMTILHIICEEVEKTF